MKKSNKTDAVRRGRPALTPEARDNQMISLAVDLAEQQLRDGTASSQVVVHYLKMASRREHLENEILEKKKEYMDAKTEAIRATKRLDELYEQALNAMRSYSGRGIERED